MKRVVPASCAVTVVSLALALIVSCVPALCQQTQSLPNMGQQITPLAPHGSRFEPLNPELPYDPAFPAGGGWLAESRRQHRGQSGSPNPADSDQWVQPCLQHPPPASTTDANLDPWRLDGVRVHL